ncbi:MAG: P-loop NTPase [Candidatus Aminicenantes bacterium]|nr:P-loop NTPase [Candidatus Aminicenantes bacterium]
MSEDKTRPQVIWAIGGGKGGTGKTFLSANLAIALGIDRGDVIAIDADLGGPNLHTLLGVRENGRDLGDFIRNHVGRLADIATPTSYPGLRLIRGSESTLFLANLNHYKKLKLIRQIKSLPAKRVIIDLGTGSAYNTLDLFVVARPGILVVTPEPTSIENTYLFLRTCALRILNAYARYFEIADFGQRVREGFESRSTSLRSFLETLTARDGSAGQVLTAALRGLKLYLVVNKARDKKDALLGRSIVDLVRKYFLINLELLGTIPYDERVHWSLKKFSPFIFEFPESAVSQAIRAMAERLAQEEPAAGEEQSALLRT